MKTTAFTASPFAIRKGIELKNPYHNIRKDLVYWGLTLNHHFLDNLVSKTLKDYMKLVKEKYHIVPPNIHRRNASERVIKTFKNNLVSG